MKWWRESILCGVFLTKWIPGLQWTPPKYCLQEAASAGPFKTTNVAWKLLAEEHFLLTEQVHFSVRNNHCVLQVASEDLYKHVPNMQSHTLLQRVCSMNHRRKHSLKFGLDFFFAECRCPKVVEKTMCKLYLETTQEADFLFSAVSSFSGDIAFGVLLIQLINPKANFVIS